jgi:N-acetylgalactosamine-N,N'-diacetylbacillosaminyl-diphospho-undecaprenol 4-alpha-N-acetylgalactosaminyltransferase
MAEAGKYRGTRRARPPDKFDLASLGTPCREPVFACRVLLIGHLWSGGGAENRFRLLARHLFGGQVTVVLFSTDGQHPLPALDLRWRDRRSYPGAALRLRNYLRRNPFDAVLSNGFRPNLVAWAAVQGLRNRPALILTETTRPRLQGFESGHPSLFGTLRRLIYPRADIFAANSEDGAVESVRYYGVDAERVRRVPGLVDPDRIELLARSGETPIDCGGGLAICVAARLERMKRIDTLLKAAAGLPVELPYRIDIIGDGREKPSLMAMAEGLGIGRRVTFHGWLENPHPIISRANLLALCSEYEGFSNAVLEAMVLRTPVITSLCSSDARDMCIKDAALGFEVGNVFQLREQLGRILKNPALGVDLAENGWRYVQRHVVRRAIGEYEAVIMDAVRHRRERVGRAPVRGLLSPPQRGEI